LSVLFSKNQTEEDVEEINKGKKRGRRETEDFSRLCKRRKDDLSQAFLSKLSPREKQIFSYVSSESARKERKERKENRFVQAPSKEDLQQFLNKLPKKHRRNVAVFCTLTLSAKEAEKVTGIKLKTIYRKRREIASNYNGEVNSIHMLPRER
jgi:DNA-directed RNA polymerase specialized sigma24 family protein